MTLLDLGKIEFKSGNYPRALERFESSLCEKADSAEPWAFIALATASTATPETFAPAQKKVDECLARAQAVERGSPFVAVVAGEAHTMLVELADQAIRDRAPQIDGYLQSLAGRTPQGIAWATGALDDLLGLGFQALGLGACDPVVRYRISQRLQALSERTDVHPPQAARAREYSLGVRQMLAELYPQLSDTFGPASIPAKTGGSSVTSRQSIWMTAIALGVALIALLLLARAMR
ncbi:MAG: hypothetical protein IT433_05475 [Phycisphaerales bacterium]|nr:hypothetical protein [Phycisphaerales bacterium]